MPFKLYVDSRFRQETGGNASDCEFSVELPHPIQVKGKAFIDTILIPNSFYVIRVGENDKIYIKENSTVYRIAQITQGQYNAITLKDAVLAALQTGRSISNNYTVTYDTPSNKLLIGLDAGSDTFTLYSGKLLDQNLSAFNTRNPGDTGPNALLPHNDSGDVTGFRALTAQSGLFFQDVTATDVVNCLPYHQLFLRSSLGNGYDAIGPDGSSDICRRIVCPVALNDVIIDQHGLPHDSVTIGNREISSLSFRLTDSFGKTVSTKGHHISFSIIFLEDD